MVYLIGWGICLTGALMQVDNGYRGRLLLFVLLLFFTALAVLRGDVGTDTAAYEIMLAEFVDEEHRWRGLEPGFVVIGWFLSILASDVRIAVRLIALVFFGMLAIFILFSDRNERFLLLAYILPAFAYQYSMNGLRIGIASAFLLIGVQLLRRHGSMPALTSGVAAVMFHYSAALSVLYLSISQIRWGRMSSVAVLALLLAGVGAMLFVADTYFIKKFLSYQNKAAPSPLSGLGEIVPILLVAIGIALGRLPQVEKTKLIALGVIATIAAWGVTQYSYAGLRILDLISFALPIAALASYSRLQLSFDAPIKGSLFLAGAVSAVAVFRGFILSQGEGQTPFLPYGVFEF